MTKPSTDPRDIGRALATLLRHMADESAEFPDVVGRVSSSYRVNHQALIRAYDAYCANPPAPRNP